MDAPVPPTLWVRGDGDGLSARARRRLALLEGALRTRTAELRTIVELAMWLHWRATGEHGAHVFRGGHVRLHDARRLYHFVRAYATAGPRWDWVPWAPRLRGGSRRWLQTHSTLDEPFEVTLPARPHWGWGCILVGTHAGGTWFQAEATSVRRGLSAFAYHNVVDYVAYRLSGRQRGPLGNSPHTDRNPIVLPADVCEEGLAAWGIP